jgi:predicted transcriptional regulator
MDYRVAVAIHFGSKLKPPSTVHRYWCENLDENTLTSTPVELATELTIAWLSNPNTRAQAEDIPAFLRSMHEAVVGLGEGQSEQPQAEPAPKHEPAVTVRKSLSSPDHIISLIDGKPYKTLRRHLSVMGSLLSSIASTTISRRTTRWWHLRTQRRAGTWRRRSVWVASRGRRMLPPTLQAPSRSAHDASGPRQSQQAKAQTALSPS